MLIDVKSKPFVAAPGVAIKVDRAVALGCYALVTGWVSGGIAVVFNNALRILTYLRQDIAATQFEDAKGFAAVISIKPADMAVVANFRKGDIDLNTEIRCITQASEISLALNEQLPRISHIARELLMDREWCKVLYPSLPLASSEHVAGFIEQAKCVSNIGVSVIGWAIFHAQADIWLVTEGGYSRELTRSIRFPRQDIVDAFSGDFGPRSEMSGFFCAINGAVLPGQKIALVAELSGRVFKLYERIMERAPSSALGYARWAFSLPVPDANFIHRMDKHDGMFINKLVEADNSAGDAEYEEWSVGASPAVPMVSVIIPLYKRADFIEHQLISFAKDPDFGNGFAEIVYVIDDPKLLNDIKTDCHYLHELYRVPMRFVFGGRNLGFSGANNLGASKARGDYLVFMNSDVFPQDVQWPSRFVNTFMHMPQYGILGARLLYPSGALQHGGMSFGYSSVLAVWLNEHPGIGLCPVASAQSVTKVSAVTGACLAITKADFQEVGGFDVGFLIGDFEDSDLCLKVRALNKEIGCFTDTNFVHLERQSVKHISSDISFRHKVVLFNAWRHSRKWSSQLEMMAK